MTHNPADMPRRRNHRFNRIIITLRPSARTPTVTKQTINERVAEINDRPPPDPNVPLPPPLSINQYILNLIEADLSSAATLARTRGGSNAQARTQADRQATPDDQPEPDAS